MVYLVSRITYATTRLVPGVSRSSIGAPSRFGTGEIRGHRSGRKDGGSFGGSVEDSMCVFVCVCVFEYVFRVNSSVHVGSSTSSKWLGVLNPSLGH